MAVAWGERETFTLDLDSFSEPGSLRATLHSTPYPVALSPPVDTPPENCTHFFEIPELDKMPVADRTPQTLYDKVLQAHVVDQKLDGTILLYIGRFCVLIGPKHAFNADFSSRSPPRP